ncbi:N-acetyltransferase, partial [Klebsiella pneumoniae]
MAVFFCPFHPVPTASVRLSIWHILPRHARSCFRETTGDKVMMVIEGK